MKSPPLIRPLAPRDRNQWDEMWAGYLLFYETTLAPDITEDSWARLMKGELIGLVAERDGVLLGFAHALTHPGTWDPRPLCYLEDLFVRDEARGHGIGRALIEALADMGRAQGWKRLYWQTDRANETGQKLYDKLAARTNWLRYDLDL